jgi:serine/threonine-protein kinase RsbW
VLSVRLTVASKIKAINPAVKRLMTMLRTTCLAPAQGFAIETALREALANAIVHGNRLNHAKNVQVCCGCDTQGIHIAIADQGDGFDPLTLPSPLAGQSLDADHGRGIFLIRTHMDEVHFEKGGREIHMRKKRRSAD